MSRFRRRSTHEYELLPRESLQFDNVHQLHGRSGYSSWLHRLGLGLSGITRLIQPSVYAHFVTPRRKKRSVLRLIYWAVFSTPYLVLFLVLFVGTFFPTYTHRPAHYNALQRKALGSTLPGRANTNNEKIFLAASIYEERGVLTSGEWGRSVLELVDLLGPDNVHLSIFENDADPITRQSLIDFEKRTTCNATIASEDLDLSALPRTMLPTGETRIKRIAFLAEVRNRALAPLATSDIHFDRMLYLNDVDFDPIDAAQLVLSTNTDATGRANYDAACAVDFINPFKFYDRFATRDLDGYNMGIPFYPWFTSAGSSTSRKDVLSGTDAVRVRSCWGGMTAYAAKWFQKPEVLGRNQSSNLDTQSDPHPGDEIGPLRFRYDESVFWESSECCLINADLQYRRTGLAMPPESGIYMNPFIRVAYDPQTLSWLWLSRRPERLYAWIHDILNDFVGFPQHNERQLEEPGQIVKDTEWEYDDPGKGLSPNATNDDFKGHYHEVTRIASPGGFCSGRQLLVINETPEQGEGRWGKIFAPRPPN